MRAICVRITFSSTPGEFRPMTTIAPALDAAADWQHDILTLEEQARAAFLGADIPTLDAMWADGFIVNSPLNMINDKARVIELLRAGRIRHSTYEVAIEQIARHGDVVIVMGRDTVDGPPDNVHVHRRFTNVWQLQGG